MWEIQHDNNDNNNRLLGFHTPPPKWKSESQIPARTWMTEEKKKSNYHTCLSPDSNLYHIVHKVPSGDSPYVKAKHVQLIEKDPRKAVALFWNAINSGDRVDSALKDMAVVMKQLDRSNEAIEAIKSFRHLCSSDSQESLDNVLLELYKRSGRLEEQIEVLRLKLKRVEEGNTFGRKKVKLARCQGKKVHITVEQEYARLLGNLAWAYLQQNDYRTAEEYYRKALSIEPDKNKQCNLAICLMCTNRITEAKILLQVIRASSPEGQMMDDSYGKSFERASELLAEIESQPDKSSGGAEKENCCGNVALSPIKDAHEFTRHNSRRVTDDQLDLKGGSYSSVDSLAMCNAVKRTNTPSFQQRRIPKSPFTQPKRKLSLSDNGKWRKETYSHGPVNCLPRRLHFDNPADLNHLHIRDLKSNKDPEQHGLSTDTTTQKIISTPNVERNDKRPPTDLSPTVEGRDLCYAYEECMPSDYKVKKSWADMVEEDEQEMMNDLFSRENVSLSLLENMSKNLQSMSINEDCELASKQPSACRSLSFKQQQPIKCKATNRLKVFQDITPESPIA